MKYVWTRVIRGVEKQKGMKKADNIEKVLVVCKPSGKGAFGSVRWITSFVN